MLTLLDSLITLLTILTATIPLFFDVIDRSITSQNKKFIARITRPGWIIVVMALVILAMVFYKDIYFDQKGKRDQELQQKVANYTLDTTKQAIIKSFNDALSKCDVKIDPKTLKAVKVDSSAYFGLAAISMLNRNDLDVQYCASRDTILGHFELHNISKTDAYNVNIHLYSLEVFKGSFLKPNIYTMDSSGMIPANTSFIYTTRLPTVGLPVIDTLFFYLKCSFTNFYKNNPNKYNELVEWSPGDTCPSIPSPLARTRIINLMGLK